LSILLNSGIQLSKALDIIKDEQITAKVNNGLGLSAALEGSQFPALALSIVRVGERTGNLAESLALALKYVENKDQLKKRVISSLIYPAFILILCFAALLMMTMILVPALTSVFNSMNVQLPLISRALIWITSHLPIIILIVSICSYALFKYSASDKGLDMPVIGGFRRKLIYASLFKTLSTSLSAGLNIIESIEIAASTSASDLIKSKLSAIKKDVLEGSSLSESMKKSGLFEEHQISMMSAGEQASSVDKISEQIAGSIEESINNDIKIGLSLVEPLFTLITGVVVGIIVFGMFMPIMKLMTVLGG
jgi:type II secretory pathway component PulF